MNKSPTIQDIIDSTIGAAGVQHLAAGRKDDGGKLEWSLLMKGCYAGLRGVVQVLMFGAKKYAADSWQLVPNARQRYKDAMYRHLSAIEEHGFYAKDPETGLLEWWHVACNALFLATFAALPNLGHKG
jgi:hypothetical protein